MDSFEVDRSLNEKAQVERTQAVLKALNLKKPPLTEKLLSKPPFRYLHDLVSEIIRTTGFGNGLFTEEEMDSNNIKVYAHTHTRHVSPFLKQGV
jgi:hypothetical protein